MRTVHAHGADYFYLPFLAGASLSAGFNSHYSLRLRVSLAHLLALVLRPRCPSFTPLELGLNWSALVCHRADLSDADTALSWITFLILYNNLVRISL